jgi:hypothetical protein
VIHAGALTREGKTLLLLADSGSGKTTLTLGLMERGWQPLADDLALIDLQTLRVRPFPRCFHVDDNTTALIRDRSMLEWVPGQNDCVRPLRMAQAAEQPTAIVTIERCETCPSARYGISRATAAGTIFASALGNRVPKSEVARLAVRLASEALGCFALRNGHLDGALNLLEGAAKA